MVGDDIDYDSDSDFLESSGHFVKLFQCPDLRVDIPVVGHIIYIERLSEPSSDQK